MNKWTVIIFICTLLYCLEIAAKIENYVVPDNTPTATLQLSTDTSQGRVAVKVYGDRHCAPHPNGSHLITLDEQYNFSNPVVEKIQIKPVPEFVFTFIYTYLTPVINDVCFATTRFPTFANKKYHAHFEFNEGWCKVRILTLINEGTENESWEKYLFAKSNDDLCIDKSDLSLLKKKRLR